MHTVTFSHRFLLFGSKLEFPWDCGTIQSHAKTLPCARSLNVINWKFKCNIAEKGNLTKIKVRQFRQQQLEQFDALLANYNWSSVFNTSGIDRKVNTFLQITENMISEYFPEKTVRIYSKDKPFMTSKIKRLILKRNTAFKHKKS